MKKLFSALFLLCACAALATGHYEAAAVGAVGAAVSFYGLKPTAGFAFLNIVPGMFVVTNPTSGMPMEVPYMSRAEKALFDQLITLKRANPVTMDVIRQGGVSFDPITYYIRAQINGGAGTQTIVDQSTQTLRGVTNIPNAGTLPQFYNFCFDKIAVRYAVGTGTDLSPAAVVGYSSIRGAMPAALGNGHLQITSNQNKIVDTPISDFTSVAAITGGGERDYDGGYLEKPRFFLELIGVQIDIAYAVNQSVPVDANNTIAVEVCFHGVQARLKA